MSNQTQAPTSTAQQTIHIWMFATAVISTLLVIPHAIVAYLFNLPAELANLHIAITLGFWLGGIAFVTRRPTDSSPTAPENGARPLIKQQRKDLSEVDELEALLRRTDEGER